MCSGKENHDDHTVEHVVIDKVLSRCRFQAHAHHHHGDGAGGMGRGESAHEVSRRERQTEVDAGQVGGECLAESTYEDHEEHHPNNLAAVEEEPHVDEHAHADKEIGDEQGVADELDAPHEWRKPRDVADEDKSTEESP